MNAMPTIDYSVKHAEDYINDSASVLVSIDFETIDKIVAYCEKNIGNTLEYKIAETDRGYNIICGNVRSILVFVAGMVDFGEYAVVSLNLPHDKPAPCYSGESKIIHENGTITLIDKDSCKRGCILMSDESFNVHSYHMPAESDEPVLFFRRQLESQHQIRQKALQALWLQRKK